MRISRGGCHGIPAVEAGARAVLARACLARGELDEALFASARALAIRDELGALEEDEGELFLTRIEVLRAAGREAEAKALHRRAREELEAATFRIDDEHWRRSLLELVPAHRELMTRG